MSKAVKLRTLLYNVVVGDNQAVMSPAHKIYSIFMTVFIIVSLVPLAFRETNRILTLIEYGCVTVFIADYLIRWLTADLKYGKGWKSIVLYPVRPMAIIDLLSILPSFTAINNAFNLCRATRLTKTIRLLKVARFSRDVELFFKILKEKRRVFLAVLLFAVCYIFFTALLMFNLDHNFKSFFEAMYWATTTLTTVGYGDIFPHTDYGRLLSMVSAIVGVAIIALPSGVITASYLKALEQLHKEENGKS